MGNIIEKDLKTRRCEVALSLNGFTKGLLGMSDNTGLLEDLYFIGRGGHYLEH
jgi:hypothetical protein